LLTSLGMDCGGAPGRRRITRRASSADACFRGVCNRRPLLTRMRGVGSRVLRGRVALGGRVIGSAGARRAGARVAPVRVSRTVDCLRRMGAALSGFWGQGGISVTRRSRADAIHFFSRRAYGRGGPRRIRRLRLFSFPCSSASVPCLSPAAMVNRCAGPPGPHSPPRRRSIGGALSITDQRPV
jgi:hypothetical protein